MDAKEVRIGNYVYFEGEVKEIGSVITAWVHAYVNFVKEMNIPATFLIIPIELTEKRLLKFGFIKREAYFVIEDTLLRLAQIGNKWHCSIGEDDNGFIFRIIESVHEIQNLYFALTGKELTL